MAKSYLNLETAIGSQKSAQALGAPDKIQKCLITTEVTTTFCISSCTPISYTAFLRPTAVSRFNRLSESPGADEQEGSIIWCCSRNLFLAAWYHRALFPRSNVQWRQEEAAWDALQLQYSSFVAAPSNSANFCLVFYGSIRRCTYEEFYFQFNSALWKVAR